MRTRDLLLQNAGPILAADGTVVDQRSHKLAPGVGVELTCDCIDVTDLRLNPSDRYRRMVAGDRHAMLRVPIPVWVAEAYLRLKFWSQRA